MTTQLAALLVSLVSLLGAYVYIAILEDENYELKSKVENCKNCFRCQGEGISLSRSVLTQLAWELKRLNSNMNLDESINHGVKRMKMGLGQEKGIENVKSLKALYLCDSCFTSNKLSCEHGS